MKSVEIDGVEYMAVPETSGCDGCAGDMHFVTVCSNLPTGCSEEQIIWVRKD